MSLQEANLNHTESTPNQLNLEQLDSIIAEHPVALSETTIINYHETFTNISRETYMLLQIILGDLDSSKVIDDIFLNELKNAVDQLRSSIYQIQKIKT